MGARSRRLREAGRDETGFTLIEQLVTMVVLVVVLGAVLALFETTAKIAPRDQERAHSIRDAQVGLDRMGRELRQAYAVNAATPNLLDVNVTIRGQSRRVLYDCNRPRCVRRQGAPGADLSGLGGEVVIDRLLNGVSGEPVFTYSPPGAFPPAHVEARVRVPAAGERADGHPHSVVLDDGLALRNISLGR